MDVLQATVETVFYPPDGERGTWYIIRTNKGTVKGNLSWRPRVGERLTLSGRWGAYRGQAEFRFSSGVADIPVTPRDTLRYVCAQTAGAGPSLEHAIYDRWGDDWADQVAPDTLPRLSGTLYHAFVEQINEFKREKERATTISWLMGKGLTDNLASAAWAKWTLQSASVVNANCYALAHLRNYGFADIDRGVRHHFGITDSDVRRINAAVVYSVTELTKWGSTAIAQGELCNVARDLLGAEHAEAITDAIEQLLERGELLVLRSSNHLARRQDYTNATAIANYVESVQ